MYYTHPKNLGPALKVDILVGKKGVHRVMLEESDEPGLMWSIAGESKFLDGIHEWLYSYVEKKPGRLPSLEYPSSTLFTERVWRKVAEIPFGTTSTYGDVALSVGHPSAYRAVGSACKKNVLMLFVPCHRVLSSNGSLSNYSGGEKIKYRLLEFEKQ